MNRLLPGDVDLEFWWLDDSERKRYQFLRPGVQRKLPNGHLPDIVWDEPVAAGDLQTWCASHHNINIHRKMQLHAKKVDNSEAVEGPIFLDFDNDNETMAEHDRLAAAARCSRETLVLLTDLNIDITSDSRVFFSGRKGFHIELRPRSIPSELLQQTGQRTSLEMKIIRRVRHVTGFGNDNTNVLDSDDTVLDKRHDAKRINGSVNAWQDEGAVKRRRVIEVAPERLIGQESLMLVCELVKESRSLAYPWEQLEVKSAGPTTDRR